MAYTVDEVSDTLGVPRPTLYRYLREYSVAHLRRAGKIYVPEESFDRIREIRELHREGLDTESVRRRLREGSSADAGDLAERLDRISETLEDLGGSKPVPNGASTAQALQTVLARQTLLISAVSNLTEMVEDLLAVNGLRRKVTDPEMVARKHDPYLDDFESHQGTNLENNPAIEFLPRSNRTPASPVRHGKFGSLTRRRRRGILVALLALLTGAALVVMTYGGAFGVSSEETPEPLQEETPASSEEIPTEDSDASQSDSADQGQEETASHNEEDYEAPTWEQPSYPVQDVAPDPLYQEQPIQQDVAAGLPYQEPPIPQPGVAGPAPV